MPQLCRYNSKEKLVNDIYNRITCCELKKIAMVAERLIKFMVVIFYGGRKIVNVLHECSFINDKISEIV